MSEEYLFEEGSEAWASREPTAYSNDDLFERPVAKPKPVSLTRPEVLAEVHAIVDDVSAVLAWSRTSSLLLLRHCRWSPEVLKDRYFEDADTLIKQSRVADVDDAFHVADAATTCGICWDDAPAGAAGSLACCHPFCFGCWRDHLEYHLRNSGVDSIAVRCPHKGCPQFCGRLAFARVFGDTSSELARYDDYIVDAFLKGNERYAPCPGPSCSRVLRYPVGRSAITEACAPVTCECGHTFCFACGQDEDHSPASCAQMRAWIKKESDESGNATWIAANTKSCPGKKCNKVIEKNGGCNHMTCTQCRYEWCWVCEGPWSEHGSSYYQCNRFREGEAVREREKQRDEARTELQRYVHYYTRYQNHHNSRKLDNVVLQRVKRRITDELARTRQSVLDLDYLQTTALVLNQCRRTLKYTYIYAYYLEPGKAKDLFEYNQAQLEYFTEVLSRSLEEDVSTLNKQDIINHTSVAERMLQKLQEGCIQVPK